MTKRVLDVGNCNPDHSSIKRLLEQSFDVEVVRVHDKSGAITALQQSSFDLVMINRLMDQDGSPGIDIIHQIRDTSSLSETPVMMITNFAEHQEAAVAAGAVPGFGKAQLSEPSTLERLRAHLA